MTAYRFVRPAHSTAQTLLLDWTVHEPAAARGFRRRLSGARCLARPGCNTRPWRRRGGAMLQSRADPPRFTRATRPKRAAGRKLRAARAPDHERDGEHLMRVPG